MLAPNASEPAYESDYFGLEPSARPGLLPLRGVPSGKSIPTLDGVIRVESVNDVDVTNTLWREIVWIDLYPGHHTLVLTMLAHPLSDLETTQFRFEIDATDGHDYIPMGRASGGKAWVWIVECPKSTASSNYDDECEGGVIVAGEKPASS